MPDRKDKNDGEDVADREKQASDKLEESLKKDGGDKPKGPEDAKRKSEGEDDTPS